MSGAAGAAAEREEPGIRVRCHGRRSQGVPVGQCEREESRTTIRARLGEEGEASEQAPGRPAQSGSECKEPVTGE